MGARHILTIEGLEDLKSGRLHPLQEAFLDEEAFQCGYCTSGMILTGVAFLKDHPHPTDEEIVRAMDGNICRCGTYQRILAAIRKAAGAMKAGEPSPSSLMWSDPLTPGPSPRKGEGFPGEHLSGREPRVPGELTLSRKRPLLWLGLVFAVTAAGAPVAPPPSDAQLRDSARQGMRLLMDGDPDAALRSFEEIQRQDPDSPLGYLFEADAYWWRIYLTIGNLVDPDVFDVASQARSPYDATFESLAREAIRTADARARTHQDVARNLLYEGMAYGLRARFYGLHDSDLPTARSGKRMRALLLQALKLDPSLTDAYLGLGIYNYFVDTLPTIVKMLKFLIGLPGGSREAGLQQLELVASKGDLAGGEAKFYLAKDYSRRSEQQYAKSLLLFQELARQYPDNLLWTLVVGSLELRLGHISEGEALYHEVAARSAGLNTDIGRALHTQAERALARMHGGAHP